MTVAAFRHRCDLRGDRVTVRPAGGGGPGPKQGLLRGDWDAEEPHAETGQRVEGRVCAPKDATDAGGQGGWTGRQDPPCSP